MPNDPVVIVGGTVLAAGETGARQADIVLNGDSIAAIVPPGAAGAAQRIDAAGRLIIPGLINAHTHGHGGLGKGIGDLWSLELLLNAGPWINGNRTDDDRYLSTLLSAVEMLRKGCTSCYDLSAMLPVPTVEGLHVVAQAYADVGMRAVIAPMVADRSFYQAIPGLLDAFPPELRPVAEAMRHRLSRCDPGAHPQRGIVLAVPARPHSPGHRADHPAALLGRVHARLP